MPLIRQGTAAAVAANELGEGSEIDAAAIAAGTAETGTITGAVSFADGKVRFDYTSARGTALYGLNNIPGISIPLTAIFADFDPAVHSSLICRIRDITTSVATVHACLGAFEPDYGGAGTISGDAIGFGNSGGFICRQYDTSAAAFSNVAAGTYDHVTNMQAWGADYNVSCMQRKLAAGGTELHVASSALAAGLEFSHLFIGGSCHGAVADGDYWTATMEVMLLDA